MCRTTRCLTRSTYGWSIVALAWAIFMLAFPGCSYEKGHTSSPLTLTSPSTAAVDGLAACVANRWSNTDVLGRGPVGNPPQPGVRATVNTVAGTNYYVYLSVYKMIGDEFFPQHKVDEGAFKTDGGDTVKVAIVATSSRENVVLSCVRGPDTLMEDFYTDDNYIDGISWP